MRFRSIVRAACALTVVVAGLTPFAAMAPAAADAVSYVSSLGGYWSTDAAGQIRTHGDAPDFGDLRGVRLNAPIVGIAATFTKRGYWLVAADGGVFTFGDARFYGSTENLHLNAPIVGILPSSRGYLLAAADGGVFTFGDARFLGSTGTMHLNAPIVGIAWLGRGYVLAASDRSGTGGTRTLPFTTNADGDSLPFTSANPITIQAHGSACSIKVHADGDGRVIEQRTGTDYTFTVPSGSYSLSNTEGCTVSAS